MGVFGEEAIVLEPQTFCQEMRASMKHGELRAFALLLVVLLAVTEVLLAHNTFYTEGEVIQALYWLLVAGNLPILIVAIWRPRIGVWSAVALGALLLPWQASENRKWAVIHEEVIAIVRHVESRKTTAGTYPPTLENYTFQRSRVGEHVNYEADQGGYRISYFMDDPGISYWYKSDDGFGYYPD